MNRDVGILFSSANLAACLTGKKTYEVMPLYEKFARQNGLRPVFFNLKHVQFHNLTVNGYVKSGHTYVQKELPLPTVIHNRTRLSPLHDKPLARLRRIPHTEVFNGTNYFNKLQVSRLLKQCPDLTPHLPDTEQLKPATVSKLIKQYPALYLKPFAKSLGRGVLKCAALPENKWQIRFQKNGSVYQRTLDQEKALPFIRHICDNRYLVQQAISVVHEDRRPIDFRVSVQKGGRGEWGVTGIVARVGLDRAIVTNVAAGGTCVPARPLLKKRFPHQHDAIYAQMRDVAIRVAAQLEKHDPTCADLGLDLAVDEDGHIWFIEVNGRDLRITFRHAGELNTWHNSFRRPMEYAAFLKKKQKSTFTRKLPSVTIVTPGSLPLVSYRSGSVETTATRLANALAPKTGVRVVGVAPLKEGKKTDPVFIPVNESDRASYLRQTAAQMRRFPSDVIQIENRPTFVPVVRKAHPEGRIVLSLHSVTYISPEILPRHALEQIVAACDAVVTNSDFLKGEVQQRVPRHAHKIHRIHLGVDVETFRPVDKNGATRKRLREQWGLSDQPTVLFVGRLIPQKGVHILLAALEHVRKEVPDVALVVVGSPYYGRNVDTAYVRQIKRHASQLGGAVRFVPFVSPQSVQDCYSVGDVFVTPSVGKEAFGLVNVEAMASSLPVVAHDVGGIKEIVEHGKTGYLVPPNSSVQSLAEKIIELLTDAEKRRSFGKAGRRRVEAHFTWERTAESYATLYNRLLKP